MVLLRFAKSVLRDQMDDWSNIPIYLKATGLAEELCSQFSLYIFLFYFDLVKEECASCP